MEDRKTEIKKIGGWYEIEFSELTKGDTFRFTLKGKPITNGKGRSEFVASSNPYHKDGVLTINIY